MAIPNQILIDSSTNTVNIQTNDNQLRIISPVCNTEVNVTQPITTVIQVATPGPTGPAGPASTSSFDTGSFATTGSNIFIGNQTITGSVYLTGLLFGTSSWANNALTASYALNVSDPFRISTGSISASVNIGTNIFQIVSGSSTFFNIDNQGSTTISSSASNIFLIKNQNNTPLLIISQSGVVILSTQSQELTGPAPNGGIYFTSASFFVGLD